MLFSERKDGMRIFCMVLCICMLVFPAPSRAEERPWYFRMIARDDSPAAQAEKIRLRDQLLPLFPSQEEEFLHQLPLILAAARASGDCRAQILIWSPDEKTPPAPTVYITIGKGGGKNWWGLLYQDAYLWAGIPGGETAPSDEIRFSWPWLRWLISRLTAPQGCSEAASDD